MNQATNTAETRIQRYFKDYASYHRTPGNQATHMVGIPMIVLSILGLFGHWILGDGVTGSELFRLDAGIIVWALTMLWYARMDWKLTLPFSLTGLGLYFLGRAIPVPALWALFVLGWIIQYVGHLKYEKKSPAFYKNAEHLLIGPFWIFAKIIGYKAFYASRS
jgi:uncharacterized membrane protein YGL010W